MNPRHYSATEDHAYGIARDSNEIIVAGIICSLFYGLLPAIIAPFTSVSGDPTMSVVFGVILVVFLGTTLGIAYRAKAKAKAVHAAVAAGPVISLAADGITYQGNTTVWADITGIHVLDFRRRKALWGGYEFGVAAVHLDVRGGLEVIRLDLLLTNATVTEVLTDLRARAEAHGIPFGTSRTVREHNAFVKADPR